MRRKGAIKARFGVWVEMLQFFVNLCITTSYGLVDQLGTESATKGTKPRPLGARDESLTTHNGRSTMTLHPLAQIRYIFGPRNGSSSHRRSLSLRREEP